MSLSRFFFGFPFLIKSAGIISISKIQSDEIYLDSKLFTGKKYRTKIFYLRRVGQEKSPVIFLTHGMSGFGIDDIRIIDVANSLASCGYTVVMPEFTEIKALKISFDSIQNIKDVFLSILDLKNLNVNQIGFFSVSFSAGYGLTAFSDPEISDKVKVIIAIGGFADLLETCLYALKNYSHDDYPTNILFFNYLHLIEDNAEELRQVFYEAALDNGLARIESEKRAPFLYNKLSKRHKEIFDRVKNDADYRMKLVDKIKQSSYGDLAISASPINSIEKIKAPVCLLHGKDDKVIPENQSMKLADLMHKYNLEFHWELTGLLAHGDKIPYWKQLSSLPRLSSTFGYFFEKLHEKD